MLYWEHSLKNERGTLMPYGHRQDCIRQKTLALVAISGKMYEEEGKIPAFLQAAKSIAREMAEELNMPEALLDWEESDPSSEAISQSFAVFVGRLAKACEALDHLEDFPYRPTLEENIRQILQL